MSSTLPCHKDDSLPPLQPLPLLQPEGTVLALVTSVGYIGHFQGISATCGLPLPDLHFLTLFPAPGSQVSISASLH